MPIRKYSFMASIMEKFVEVRTQLCFKRQYDLSTHKKTERS